MWLSLLVILPMPVFGGCWGWLPGWHIAGLLQQAWLTENTVTGLVLAFQLALAILACGGLAQCYVHYSRLWAVKIRGSIMGIIILTLLVLLATFPLYRSIDQQCAAVTFMEL